MGLILYVVSCSLFAMAFFDIESKIRTDGEFKDWIKKQIIAISKLENSIKEDNSKLPDYQAAVAKLLQALQWNVSPLLSYFFPKYPSQQPFNLKDYPQSYAYYDLNVGRLCYTVLRGSRQIAKTTGIVTRDTILANLIPNLALATIVPRHKQLETIAKKYNQAVSAYRGFTKSSGKFNVYSKSWANGSTLDLFYVLTTADDLRGNTIDVCTFDEFQDFDPALVGESLQIIKKAKFPLVTYSGTSKSVDTALEEVWTESSQNVWCMPCPHCHCDNIPTLDNDVYAMIRKEGVCCKKCGKKLNVRNGFWLPLNPKADQYGLRGFHIPQIVVPPNVENVDEWALIYKEFMRNDKTTFNQEVLGEATESAAREITREQLQNICTLGDQNELLKKAQLSQYQSNPYKYIVSGCDWGGSDENPASRTKQSWTAHVMLGLTYTGEMHVLHFRKYAGMNYADIANDIIYNHKKYRGYAVASDYGVGMLYNQLLRQQIDPMKHVIFNLDAPRSVIIQQPKKSAMFNLWSLNKTESITAMFNAIKDFKIRAPNWEQCEDYLNEFLNIIRNPYEDPNSGATKFVYARAANKPNDFAMATLFAFRLSQIIMGEKLFVDAAQEYILKKYLFGGPQSPRGGSPLVAMG